MYKIEVNNNFEKINVTKLKKYIKINIGDLNTNRKIPKKCKLILKETEYGDQVWITGYSYLSKREKKDPRKKVEYDKETFSSLIWLENDINDFYFGPNTVKNEKKYNRGNTLYAIAKMVATLIVQFEKYEGRRFDITIDLVNDTRLFDDELEVFMHFFEIREECYESYMHFYNGSMINILVET